ncbi:MAG: porin [Pseudomonadota bacterium]
MKKVLLTSTALVMTAGVAFAEVSPGVSLSGSAELGIKDKDGFGGADPDAGLQFHNDLDLDINFAAETDGGLAFGASIDLDEVGVGISADDGPAAAFISFGGFKLEMGDVDGALDLVNQEIGFLSSIDDDHTTHAGYFGGGGLDGGQDGQIATLSYTGVPGLILAVSAEIGDVDTDDEIYGVGVQYNFDLGAVEIGASLGYQEGAYSFSAAGAGLEGATATLTSIGIPTSAIAASGFAIGDLNGDAEIWAVSLELDTKTGFVARLNYADLEGNLDNVDWSYSSTIGLEFDGTPLTETVSVSGTPVSSLDIEWDYIGIGVLYETGPWGFTANYGEFDGNIEGFDFDADGFGLAVNYDLGGGASVQFGYGSGESFFDDESIDTWSFGLGMSF